MRPPPPPPRRPKQPPTAQQQPPPESPPPEPPPPPGQPPPPPPPHTPANPAHRRFKTGATPTPPEKREAAPKFTPPRDAAPATQKAWVPKRLSMWGNDQYGDCVSAEEAFAKACHSPELFCSDQEVIDWARAHDGLNGAMLDEVLDQMARDGIVVADSQDPAPWKDGAKRTVDYRDETVLKAALATGPVKIGIMSSALPDGAGNQSGWHAVGPGRRGSEDHAVALCGFGPARWLYEQLGVSLPGDLRPEQTGYLLYTWKTIGFVDHAWLVAACGEAWIREPTTVEHGPTPPPPPPPPPGPPAAVAMIKTYDADGGELDTYYLGDEPPKPAPGPTLQVGQDIPAGRYARLPDEHHV